MSEHAVDLVLHAPVSATDGPVGRVEHVILDPQHGRATHVVVRETELPNTLRLVAEKHIAKATPDGVVLSITRKHFELLQEYILTDYFSPSFFLGLAGQEQLTLPMAPSGWTVERPTTPEGAVALVGHEAVLATDGKVGRVDGVLADRASGRVTHLVLREGHLFGHREVQVPAAMVARYADATVHLNVDKAAIAALPDVHA